MAKEGSAVPSSALSDLHLALADADIALVAADASEEARIAALLALKAVYDFLKSVGLRSSALNNLSMALQDVDRGDAPKLFAPAIQNRPKEKARLFILKAVAAAAMQLLMESKKKKSEAAAIVARKLSADGFRSRQPISAMTIARWRDRFSGHSEEEGGDAYAFALQTARATHPTPARQAEHVMRGLKRLVKNLGNLPS